MRTLFIHVFTATTASIKLLRRNSINPIAFSLPQFVAHDSAIRRCLNENGISVFNIDSVNYLPPRDLSREHRNLPSQYIGQLLMMSQRLPYFRQFGIQELVTRFRDIYSTCVEDILLSQNVELLCFGGLPHSVADYILLLAAKGLGIKSIVSQDFPLFPGGSVFYDEALTPLPSQINPTDTLQQDYYEFCKMTVKGVQQEYYSTGKFIPFKTNDGLDAWNAVYSGDSAELGSSSAGELYKKEWNSRATCSLPDRLVTVFLHAEPEAFTNPAFPLPLCPQIESIASLRSFLDSDISILVKEHPSMFGAYPDEDSRYLELNRSLSSLDQICATQNVKLLNSDISARDCIDASEFVFCACGSVSFQAILSRKVVAGVAFSPISRHPGFVDIQHISSAGLLQARNMLSAMSCDQIAESLVSLASPGSPNGSFNMFVTPDETSNSTLYFASLLQHVRNM